MEPTIMFDTDTLKVSEIILSKIKQGDWQYILNGICNIRDNALIIDIIYVKHFATKETQQIIIDLIINNINNVLNIYAKFVVHVNINSMKIRDVDNNRDFIRNMSKCLKERFTDKLDKCYIYNATAMFSQILNVISLFIDKDTKEKIQLIK
jgi:hypothetical protein